MAAYNAPFFSALTAVFLLYKEKHGEEQALGFMREVFSRRLGPVYDQWGFRRGNPQDFARVAGKNDRLLGLKVEFLASERGISYRFYTDPFPGLKGKVDHRKFDQTYMAFKISHLLGPEWTSSTPRHLWDGNRFTEHVITRGK